MRPRLPLILTAAAGAAVVSAVPVSAAAPGYEFVVIADSAQGFDPFEFGCAAINNDGQVAFRTAARGVDVVLRGEGGPLTKIADERDGATFIGRNPSMNVFGQVSFAANIEGGGEAIFKGDGTFLRPVAKTSSDFRFFGFDTSISDSGRVAFKAELDNDDQGLFSAQRVRKPVTEYLDSETDFHGDQSGPSIGIRHIAFSETRDDFSNGIFTTDKAGKITTIADDSGPIGFTEDPSIGTGDQVAFHAFLDDGGEAIMIGSGGPLTTVAGTSGPYQSFSFKTPSLNTLGDVAFGAVLDSDPTGNSGVYTGPNPATDAVLIPGDALAGSTVLNVVSCGEALNDGGQIAVESQLEDGRTLIVRADPS